MKKTLWIGVKYCGGCMAVYDRVKTCKRILSACPGLQWEYVKDGHKYDYTLILQGCPRKCADTKDPQFEKIEVSCPEEGEQAVEKIKMILSNRNLEES